MGTPGWTQPQYIYVVGPQLSRATHAGMSVRPFDYRSLNLQLPLPRTAAVSAEPPPPQAAAAAPSVTPGQCWHTSLCCTCLALTGLFSLAAEADRPLAWALIYLLLSPLLHVSVVCFHVLTGRRWWQLLSHLLAMGCGNVAALCLLLSQPHATLFLFLSLVLGSSLHLVNMHKVGSIKVMLCTACTVFVVLLSCLALVLDDMLAWRCFASTAVPLLFLYWISGTTQLQEYRSLPC